MYKLMLVTTRQEVMDAFNGVPSWEAMGFRKPRMAAGAQEAIEMLGSVHVDGIAFDLPREEEEQLMAFLSAEYPILPIFEACSKTTALVAALKELRGISVDELATRLGMKPNTVTVKLKRTRKRLHGYLAERGYRV